MRYYVYVPLMLMLLAGMSYAGTSPAISSYLSAYVPNSVIANSTFTNITYGTNVYILMHISPSKNILINITNGHYSIVLNNSTAYRVLAPYLKKAYAPSPSLISRINSTIALYQKQANPPLADCLIETGVGRLDLIHNNSLTNTTATNACFTVPECRKSFYNYSGETGPLIQGIREFGNEYINLNNSYRSFFTLASTLNSTNFYSNVQGMLTDINNFTTIQKTMPSNPIFPLPANFNPSLLGTCINYNQNNMPWYCQDIGDCEFTTFNSTTLNNAYAQVSALLALPVYNKTIQSYADNVTLTASSYVEPLIIKQNTTALDIFLNATLPKYNSTVSNAKFALSKVSNSTLSSALSDLESEMSSIISAGINQNITKANTLVSNSISNVSKLTETLLLPYDQLVANAQNSTAEIMLKQLDYINPPPKASFLGIQQQKINSELSGGLNKSSLDTLMLESSAVESNASKLPTPISMPAFLKSIDGGLVSAMLYGSNASIPSKEASAPLYAALISFIIAIILILVFYGLTYARLSHKHKLRLSKRVKRAWLFLFIGLLVIGLIYAAVTYSIASSATSFLPVSSFMSQAASSNTVLIAINGTNTLSLSGISSGSLGCAGALQQTLKNAGKRTGIIAVQNYTCTVSNVTASSKGSSCYNEILGSGTPLIQIDEANSSYISYKGMYGTVLYASGNAASGTSCYLNTMLKHALSTN